MLYLRVCVEKIRIVVIFQRLPGENWSWVELFELKKKVFYFVCIVNTYLCALDDLVYVLGFVNACPLFQV